MIRRLFNLVFGLGVMGALVYGFFTMMLGERLEITISEQDVQRAVAGSLPVSKNVMKVAELRLESPRIGLDDKLNRINARLETRLQLQGIPIALKGHIIASGELVYRPDQGTFYLQDIEVKKIEVKGLPGSVENKMRDGVTVVTKEVLGAIPVYRLNDTEFRERAAKLVLKKVRVEQGKMVLTMGMG